MILIWHLIILLIVIKLDIDIYFKTETGVETPTLTVIWDLLLRVLALFCYMLHAEFVSIRKLSIKIKIKNYCCICERWETGLLCKDFLFYTNSIFHDYFAFSLFFCIIFAWLYWSNILRGWNLTIRNINSYQSFDGSKCNFSSKNLLEPNSTLPV